MKRNYKDEIRIKKRKKAVLRVFLALFIVITVSIGLVYLLFFADLFDLRLLNISGTENISRDELKTAAENWLNAGFLGITRNRNFLFVSSKKLALELTARFPRINYVEVGKRLLHGLEISVIERKPAGVWCFPASARCFYFDKDGIAYAEAEPSSGFLILNIADYREEKIALSSRIASDEWFKNIITAKELLPKIGVDVAEFAIPSGSFDEFDAVTAPGWKILFSNSTDIAKQIASLGILFRDNLPAEKRAGLQYIDLRIQDRIYYR